jgi:hypothetical protein
MPVPNLFDRQNSLDALQFVPAIRYILRARISQREECQIETTMEGLRCPDLWSVRVSIQHSIPTGSLAVTCRAAEMTNPVQT